MEQSSAHVPGGMKIISNFLDDMSLLNDHLIFSVMYNPNACKITSDLLSYLWTISDKRFFTAPNTYQ